MIRRIVIGLSLLASAAAAQPSPELVASFTALQTELGEVTSSTQQQDQLLQEIASNAIAVQSVAFRIEPDGRAAFARSISYNATLLTEAQRASPAQATLILGEVADDLRIKRASAASMGASTSFPGRVTVMVTTVRGANAVNGYEITLNPVLWRGQEPMYRLTSLSPATGTVPPGRYEVSALKNGAVANRNIYRIGLDADDVIKIQLPVP